MNVDRILQAMNGRGAEYLLIGGMNFALNHDPVLTFDVDLWVWDAQDNLRRVNLSLGDLGGKWRPMEATWRPVPPDSGWLQRQAIFCLTTRHGALDSIRSVKGLEGRFNECHAAANPRSIGASTPYLSLSDGHMLGLPTGVGGARAQACPHGGPAGGHLGSQPMNPGDKRAEEAKRDRVWDPAQRWRAFEAAIAFVEENLPPERRRNRPLWHRGERPAADGNVGTPEP